MLITTSVLNRPIFSVYPKLGNQRVRKDLHRVIKARETGSESMVYVTWSTIKKNMVADHWFPNHCVPILPIDVNSNHPIEAFIVTKTLRKSGMHIEETCAEEWFVRLID